MINRHERMEELLNYFTHEQLLIELVHALSDQEAKENFDFIKRMHSIFDDEED